MERREAAPHDHPQRIELANEIHARPAEALQTPERASYIAVVVDRTERDAEHRHLVELCDQFGVAPPPPDASHFSARLGELRLKWERHTEFTGYGFYAHGEGDFDHPASVMLPDRWLANVPGRMIAAAHTIVIKYEGEGSYLPIVARWRLPSSVIGAEVGDGAALAFSDLRIRDDGFERFVILDRRLSPLQAGRTAKRLFEIEAYRVMALLALPVAREQGPQAAEMEQQLAALTGRISQKLGRDEDLLGALTSLAARAENSIDASEYRFSASRAYFDLVRSRIAELRERKLPGIQTFDEFMSARLTPAMATCASVSQRLRDLSERVSRACALLSTRVEIARERQNQALLESMERRARLQLRLQQTVEGLSIAAITYYLAGLVGYVAKGVHAIGVHLDYEIAVAVAIPIIAYFVWRALKRVRRKLGHEAE